MRLLCRYGRLLMSLQRQYFPIRDHHNNLVLICQRWRRRPVSLAATLPLPLVYLTLLMSVCLGITSQAEATDSEGSEISIAPDPSLPSSKCWVGELRLATPWILRDVFLVNVTRYPYQERQCLASQSAQEYCDSPPREQRRRLTSMYLKFCSAYPVYPILKHNCSYSEASPYDNSLSNNDGGDDDDNYNNSTEVCKECIRSVEDLDRTVQAVYEQFEADVMSRYDCEGKQHHQGDKNHTYSVNWNCDHCKQAYKAWLCAMYIPYYQYGRLLNPCTSLCKAVEERCPYFLPVSKNQYAGEPAFICTVTSIKQPPDVYTPCRDGCYQLCEDSHEICPPRNVSDLTQKEIEQCTGGAASTTKTAYILLFHLLLLLLASSFVTSWISSFSLPENIMLGVFNFALGLT